jgi:hypothetical protein
MFRDVLPGRLPYRAIAWRDEEHRVRVRRLSKQVGWTGGHDGDDTLTRWEDY